VCDAFAQIKTTTTATRTAAAAGKILNSNGVNGTKRKKEISSSLHHNIVFHHSHSYC
jgi:hypothetical protein